MARRRKFWGWGVEDAGPTPEQEHGIARIAGARFGAALDLVAAAARRRDRAAAPRVTAALGAARDLLGGAPRPARPHLRQGLPRRGARAAPRLRAGARPGRLPARRGARSPRVLDWCTDAQLACIPYGGGSSVVGGVEARVGEGWRGRRLARPRPARPRRSRSTAPRAPRASRAACSAPRSRTSCARTGSRCATTRSPSSSRRSAAGSRRAPAATTRRSTRTSTSSSSRCAW